MPTRPDDIHERITSFTNNKLPAFFKYAKDKMDNQVEEANGSFVNRLTDIIPNVRLNFRSIGLGKVDYTLLMSNPDIECRVKFTSGGKVIKEETDPMILKYIELNKKYYFKIDSCEDILHGYDKFINNSQLREYIMHKRIKDEIITELSKFGYTDSEIADILVKFLYGIKDSKHKDALWLCYGDIIYSNLQSHVRNNKKIIQCEDCGEWIEVSIKDTKSCKCPDCYSEYRKQRKLETQRMRRKKKSDQTISQNALN